MVSYASASLYAMTGEEWRVEEEEKGEGMKRRENERLDPRYER